MDINTVRFYIKEYKRNFDFINHKEIYKWQATKVFKGNWDIDCQDFPEMVERSLKLVKNLMDSGQYFPKRMLINNVKLSSGSIKELFKRLYDEEIDLYERIEFFQLEFNKINSQNYGSLKTYQDHRALLVYLALKYPERYFFYKFDMFKKFSEKIDYSYKPVKGRIENVGQFLNMCDLVRHELLLDKELLQLHKNRMDESCYFDQESNLLTQDFIYAVVSHLQRSELEKNVVDLTNTVINVKGSEINVFNDTYSFNGSFTNFIKNNIENKRIGDLGELWVLDYEKQKIRSSRKLKYLNKVIHISSKEGDGTGFDIQSVDNLGNTIYIEVKTTKGDVENGFFITRTELERSKAELDNFYLYRLYNFDEVKRQSNLLIIRGDLSHLCSNPCNYKVNLDLNTAQIALV